MKYAPLLLLFLASPACAHGWPGGDLEGRDTMLKARAEYRLDCGQLNAVIEAQRWQTNQRALNQFGRVQTLVPIQPVNPLPARPR
jgi:hypothetical protein